MTNALRKYQIANWLSYFFILITLFIFLAACWAASADAQSGVVILFAAPMILASFFAAFFLGRYAARTMGSGRFAERFSKSLFIYILVFYFSSYVPGFGLVSKVTIDLVAQGFQKVTGQTPYQWERAASIKAEKAKHSAEKRR